MQFTWHRSSNNDPANRIEVTAGDLNDAIRLMSCLRRTVVQVIASFAIAAVLVFPLFAAEGIKRAVVLVAKPELQDPNFAHSVILVVFDRIEGPVGIILNRPTPVKLKDVFADSAKFKNRTDALFFGGPVQPRGLLFVFETSTPQPNAFKAVDDLYLSADGALLDRLLTATPARIQRFFMGYSGWASVQLDAEIAGGAWYVLPVERATVLAAKPETLWRDLILRATAVRT